jgi:hypothetical protein
MICFYGTYETPTFMDMLFYAYDFDFESNTMAIKVTRSLELVVLCFWNQPLQRRFSAKVQLQ